MSTTTDKLLRRAVPDLKDAWPVAAKIVLQGADPDGEDVRDIIWGYATGECKEAMAEIVRLGDMPKGLGDALLSLQAAVAHPAYVLGLAVGIRLARALED